MKHINSWVKILTGILVVLFVNEAAGTLSSLSRTKIERTNPNSRNTRSTSDGRNTTITPGNLAEVFENIVSNTNLLLTQGTYLLENFTLITGVSDICISGQGDVTITCSKDVGLVFIDVRNLLIDGIRIEGCGLSGAHLDSALTRIREFIDFTFVVYSEMRFAVLLVHCENTVIENVQVANNTGFGLVGINLMGSSTIKRLIAMNNTQSSNCISSPADRGIFTDPLRYGGGAVLVYQDYIPVYQTTYNNSFNELTISKGVFESNSECSFNYFNFIRSGDPTFIRNLGYRLGGGGGLSLLVTQISYGLRVLTSDSHFENNVAIFGGSGHIALFSGVKNTHIEFINCTFTLNGIRVSTQDQTNRILGGAGLGITVDNRRPDNEQVIPPHVAHNLNTTIRIVDSRFTKNIASFGASVYFYSAYTSAVSDLDDVLYMYIENCVFEMNQAFIGPGLQLMEYKYGSANVGVQISIKDSEFVNNTVITIDPNGAQSILQSAGVIDFRYLNVSFHGNCRIEENSGTGLRSEVSYVGIAGNITFKNNVGIQGGAMHLQRYSYLIVLPNASLHILDNVARVAGGGIFSNFLGLNTFLTGGDNDCFLYFNYETISYCENCSDLNRTGSFINLKGNTAPSGGQIFGSAFQRCAWAVDLLISLKLPLTTSILEYVTKQFPNVIDIDGSLSDPTMFKTQSQSVRIIDPSNTPVYDTNTSTYNVVPGQTFNADFVATDNYNHTISNVLSSFISTNISTLFTSAIPTVGPNNFGVLQDNTATTLPITIVGSEGQSLTVAIFSNDLVGKALTEISVNLGYCGNGFVYDSKTRTCVCDQKLVNLGITCDTEKQTLTVPNEKWLGPVDGNNTLGVADCLLFFCLPGSNVISIENGVAEFDYQCNAELFRRGVLCEQCVEGRSFVLGSPRCLECSNVAILLFPFFMAFGLLMLIMIYYLDITIAEGLLNGAIFFSNIVVLYAYFLLPSDFGSNFIFIISFLTLNFGIESCLYDGMGGLDRLWWQLSFPLYLVALMGVIALLARTKYLQIIQKSNQLSVTRAFTTLSLLCYVSVLQVCVEVLAFSEIQMIDGKSKIKWMTDPTFDYFTYGHIPMVFIALILILVYLIPFPFFLLFPSLVFKSRCLRELKPFYDAYWHPFEPKFRFWLGFRLIFRWLPFILALFVPDPINVFVTNSLLLVLLFVQLLAKPFKSWWVNTMDSIFIFLLIFMFTGTLYFAAEIDIDNVLKVENGLTIYNQIITVLAFLLMVVLFHYHLYIRFQKVKQFSQKIWHKLRCKKGEYTTPETETEQISEVHTQKDSLSRDSTGTKPKTTTTKSVVSTTDLREPLLEDDGFATVISVPAENGQWHTT